MLHVRVTAPPEGGKANAAVVALVAKSLRVPSSSVSIVKGFASRDKVLRVNLLTLDEIKERLAASQLVRVAPAQPNSVGRPFL